MRDSIGDGVIAVDLAGAITYLNPAAATLTGWSQDAAAGRPFDQVFRIIDRETGERSRNPLRLAMALDTTVGLSPNCLLVSRDGARAAIDALPLPGPLPGVRDRARSDSGIRGAPGTAGGRALDVHRPDRFLTSGVI